MYTFKRILLVRKKGEERGEYMQQNIFGITSICGEGTEGFFRNKMRSDNINQLKIRCEIITAIEVDYFFGNVVRFSL